MKATLSFNLPEERPEFDEMLRASNLSRALEEILNDIFRPARKHGYSDERLQKLSDETLETIGILEEKTFEILKSWDIK